MNLRIENSELYVDNLRLCFAGAGNGRPNLQPGRYEVVTQYSPHHGKILPDAVGLGWIGPFSECDVILGGVRGRYGVIPSPASLERALARIEAAEDAGESVTLEVASQ